MRWLFLVVLSLNLAYIAWQTSVPGEDPVTYMPPLKKVETIVLLSEIKQQSVAVEKKTSPVEDAELPVAKENAVEEDKAEPAERAPGEVASEKMADVVVVDAKKPEVELSKEDPVSSSVSAIAEASCHTLGPFRDLDKLRSFTREIKSYVVEADFRGREEKEQTLYWVYIQPEKSHKSALAMGKRLKAKKIKDFYVIREGEKIHGVSLGHFRNKDGAYGLVKKVKKLGFDVRIEPVFKTYTVYWLDYQLASGVSIPESIVNKHIKSAQKDKISRLSRDCVD